MAGLSSARMAAAPRGRQKARPDPILSDLPGCHWTFVGWGPMPPADGDSATVRLAGRLPPQEIVGEYQAADLLVLPSVGEGFPLVVQEALACGTPVLVSRDVAQAFPARDRRCVFEVDLWGLRVRSCLLPSAAHGCARSDPVHGRPQACEDGCRVSGGGKRQDPVLCDLFGM